MRETHRWRNPENWREEIDIPDHHTSYDGVGDIGVHADETYYSEYGISSDFSMYSLQNARNIMRKYNEKEAPSYANVGEHRALQAYTASWHSEINKYMRGEIQSITDEEKGMMQSLQELMTPMNEPLTLYRGIPESMLLDDDGRSVEEGKIVSLKSFTSTSRDPYRAFEFTKGGTFIELRTNQHTEAITLSNDDTAFNEEETIVNAGQSIYIEEIHNARDLDLLDIFGDDFTTYIVAAVVPNHELDEYR